MTLSEINRAKSFGTLLKRFREKACWTQQDLAEHVGLSAHTIRDYERGNRKPQCWPAVANIAEALSLTPEEKEEFNMAYLGMYVPRQRLNTRYELNGEPVDE